MAEESNNNYQLIVDASKIKKYFKDVKLETQTDEEINVSLDKIASEFTKEELRVMKQTLNNNMSHGIARQTAFYSFFSIVIAFIAILASTDIFSNKGVGSSSLIFIFVAYTIIIVGYFIYNSTKQEKDEKSCNYLELLISFK
ncbi:hypothetical protein [Planococcus rifietoensis]|uniref:hypothetical protein n=1 Tax=Planococcus rifietoensis TaxID=200991 RepID=UPI00384D048E